MKKNRNIIYIVIFSLLLKILAAFTQYDYKNMYYWEYGEIAENIINGKGYSLFYHHNSELVLEYNEDSKPYPTAYMPPLYVYYILPFLLIDNDVNRNIIFILFQILISLALIVLIYIWTKHIFSEKTALFAGLITACLPEFIFSAITPGPTLLYHILILLFFIYYSKSELKIKQAFVLGIIAAILSLLRSEFILFIIILFVYLLIKKNSKPAFIFLSLAMLMLLPWQIRIVSELGGYTAMSTSGGLNFYRGHNPYGPGTWSDQRISDSLNNMPGGKDFELRMNKFYFNEAFSFIKSNPETEISNSVIKLFHLWLMNPNDNRSFNLLYLLPWILILLFAIAGLLLTLKRKKLDLIYLFLLYHTLLAIVFFALPRYQTMMKIALIPFVAFAFQELLNLIKAKRKIL